LFHEIVTNRGLQLLLKLDWQRRTLILL
jgi:hypothetical protein